MTRLEAMWEDGFMRIATVRRRWFPWPIDSVVFGRTIWTRLDHPTPGHLRHELTHVRQYAERGWFWVFTHPTQRETEARAAQVSLWPKWNELA